MRHNSGKELKKARGPHKWKPNTRPGAEKRALQGREKQGLDGRLLRQLLRKVAAFLEFLRDGLDEGGMSQKENRLHSVDCLRDDQLDTRGKREERTDTLSMGRISYIGSGSSGIR